MNEKERLDLAEWAMNHALKSGATEVAARLTSERKVEIEFRDKQLDKLQDSQWNRLGLDIYLDQRFSSHSTNDLRKDALAKFIDEALASTKYLAKDQYRSLPDTKYYPGKSEGDLRIYDPGYDKIETPHRVRMAADIEAAAMAESGKIISTTAGYADTYTELVQVHSNGFVGGARGTRYEAGADVTVQDEGGGRPEDWFWAETRFRGDLPAASVLGKKAGQRALRKLGQKKIDSGQYDCVVENRAGGRFMRMLMEPLSGRALQQKSSFLDGMVGKQIASDKFTVVDAPSLEKGLGSRLFDGDGLAARKMVVIDKGVLRNYYIDAYYGRKLGMEPTTGWPSNVVFDYGSKSLEGLVKDIKKGILVNGFIGGNSNSTTGDFSVGITGLLIENGETGMPVHEMNISGNARELLGRLAAMGSDPWLYSPFRVPSMLFEGVHFSGI
jgi:PmbA protein